MAKIGIAQIECKQSHNPAFTIVICTHYNCRIFNGNDHGHGPEDNGQNTQYVCRGDAQAMCSVEGFFQCIEWTGSNIPKHDP